jgi:hypothetical protein
VIDAIIVIVVKKLRYVSYGKVIHYNKLFNPAPAWPSAIIPLSKYHQDQAAGAPVRFEVPSRAAIFAIIFESLTWRTIETRYNTLCPNPGRTRSLEKV